MKKHRFIVDFPLVTGKMTVRESALIHQMRSVLRLVPEERIILSDGQGQEAEATIRRIEPEEVELDVLAPRAPLYAGICQVVLYCAVLKNDHFDVVVQKATEVGVARIVPLLTDRTVKRNVRLDRLQKIAQEAAEQCGRTTIPFLEEPQFFEDCLRQVQDGTARLFLHTAPAPLLRSASTTSASMGSIHLFIGPEGGWTDRETQQATQAGCLFVSLGPYILRGETAAIIAAYESVMIGAEATYATSAH